MKSLVLSVVTIIILAACWGSAAGSHWDVTVTKVSGDTVWVQVTVNYEDWTPCEGDWEYLCEAWVNLRVDPCPVFDPSPGCFYEQGFHTLWPSAVTFQLQAGAEYIFGGNASAFVGYWDSTIGACHFTCSESSSFRPFVFNVPIATTAETWGGIKTLFR
jgi:hypothetical protein